MMGDPERSQEAQGRAKYTGEHPFSCFRIPLGLLALPWTLLGPQSHHWASNQGLPLYSGLEACMMSKQVVDTPLS